MASEIEVPDYLPFGPDAGNAPQDALCAMVMSALQRAFPDRNLGSRVFTAAKIIESMNMLRGALTSGFLQDGVSFEADADGFPVFFDDELLLNSNEPN